MEPPIYIPHFGEISPFLRPKIPVETLHLADLPRRDRAAFLGGAPVPNTQVG